MKKVFFKILITFLVLSMSVPYLAFADTGDTNYSDIKSTNWAYEAVDTSVKADLFNGDVAGTFLPEKAVTYAEFIKMMDIAVTGEDVDNSTEGNWALKFYQHSLDNGLFSNSQISKKQLNQAITRKDVAMIIANVSDGAPNIAYANNFSDVTADDTDILEAVTIGVLDGYSDGTFKPNGTLSGAEAATVLWKFTDESKRVISKLEDVVETIPRDEVVKSIDPAVEEDSGLLELNKLETIEYAPSHMYFWEKYELNGVSRFSSNTAIGLGILYYLQNGVITQRCTYNCNSILNDMAIFYESTPEERENAYEAEYLISLNPDTNVGTILPNPMYNNI